MRHCSAARRWSESIGQLDARMLGDVHKPARYCEHGVRDKMDRITSFSKRIKMIDFLIKLREERQIISLIKCGSVNEREASVHT